MGRGSESAVDGMVTEAGFKLSSEGIIPFRTCCREITASLAREVPFAAVACQMLARELVGVVLMTAPETDAQQPCWPARRPRRPRAVWLVRLDSAARVPVRGQHPAPAKAKALATTGKAGGWAAV